MLEKFDEQLSELANDVQKPVAVPAFLEIGILRFRRGLQELLRRTYQHERTPEAGRWRALHSIRVE